MPSADVHEDSQCIDAMRIVDLQGLLEQPEDAAWGETSSLLAFPISAGGANLPPGKRQLVALARALLRRSPLVVMDEATLGITPDIDAIIQSVLRDEFLNSLLITGEALSIFLSVLTSQYLSTVVHRLRNAVNYDRIVVLHQGKVR
jgi:ABC-type multidrug transport system fused ATPase/permease subunit